jgi:hypothetical protein
VCDLSCYMRHSDRTPGWGRTSMPAFQAGFVLIAQIAST